jgi:hypothetical protein
MKHISTDQSRKKLGTLGRAAGVALGALLLLSAACSSSGDEPGGTEATESTASTIQLSDLEVASVTLKSGNVVSWHELAPGLLVTRESFTYPSPPQLTGESMDLQALSALDVYRTLAPEKAVPETLKAAYDRTQILGFVDDATAVELEEMHLDGASISEQGDGLGRSQQAAVNDSACSWTWFAPHCYLCATGPCGRYQVRWPQITGDSAISHKASLQVAAMCVYRGTVRHVFKLHGKAIQDTLQRAGNGTRYFLNNGAHDFTLSTNVTQAAGAGYHHCFEGT